MSEWISVKDRMPPLGYCIVFGATETELPSCDQLAGKSDDYYTENNEVKVVLFLDKENPEFILDRIYSPGELRHWMELPKNPEAS